MLNLPLLDFFPDEFPFGFWFLIHCEFLSQFISHLSHVVVIFTMTVTLPAMDDPAALRRLLGECSMASILIEHIVGMRYTTIATIAHALGDPERLEDFVEHLSLVPTDEKFKPFSPQTASIRRAARECMSVALEAGRSSAPDSGCCSSSHSTHSCRSQRTERSIFDQLSRRIADSKHCTFIGVPGLCQRGG